MTYLEKRWQGRRVDLVFLGLVVCGVVLAVVFHAGLAGRYSLSEYLHLPRQSVGDLNNYSDDGALIFFGTFIALFGVYWIGYKLTTEVSSRFTARNSLPWVLLIVGFALVFNVILLALYPINSLDIFEYIMRGRISTLYGLNPYIHVPAEFPNDPFLRYTFWHYDPTFYGPVWALLSHLASSLAGEDLLRNVYAFKLLTIIGYTVAAVFIGLTLYIHFPRRFLTGLYLFSWNPLVLYMTAGTGHNDALMTACIVASLFFLMQRHFVTAMAAATLGILFKFIPVILVPVIALAALKELRGAKRLQFLVLAAVVCGLLVVGFYAPYWTGIENIPLEARLNLIDGSVGSIARRFLLPVFDQLPIGTTSEPTPNTNNVIGNGTLVVFGLLYVWQLVILWRNRDSMTPIRVAARVFVFFLLIASLWFQAWYVTWLVALVSLLENTPLRRVILAFSFLAIWQELFKYYIVVVPRNGSISLWTDLTLVSLYMGYPFLYTVVYQIRAGLLWLGRSAADVSIGALLRQARTAVGLTATNISDRLNIPYDLVLQYEAGAVPLRLDHARRFADLLNLPMSRLFAAPTPEPQAIDTVNDREASHSIHTFPTTSGD